MSETDAENEMLDAIVMAMKNGFRSYIGALHTGIAARQDPRIKEEAYRILRLKARFCMVLPDDQKRIIVNM